MQKKSFAEWYRDYLSTEHGAILLKETIRYYRNTCCSCGKYFPSNQLTTRHISFQNLYHESIGIDVICSCFKCLKSVYIQPLKKSAQQKLVKITYEAYQRFPKWKNEYHIFKYDKERKTVILTPKSSQELNSFLNGTITN